MAMSITLLYISRMTTSFKRRCLGGCWAQNTTALPLNHTWYINVANQCSQNLIIVYCHGKLENPLVTILLSCTDPLDGFHNRKPFLDPESVRVILPIASNCLWVNPFARSLYSTNLVSVFNSSSLNPAANSVHKRNGVGNSSSVWIKCERIVLGQSA